MKNRPEASEPRVGATVWRINPYLFVHRDTMDWQIKDWAERGTVEASSLPGKLNVRSSNETADGVLELWEFAPDEWFASERAALEAAALRNENEGKELLDGAARLREYVALHLAGHEAADAPEESYPAA
jgi:hypothetical protein